MKLKRAGITKILQSKVGKHLRDFLLGMLSYTYFDTHCLPQIFSGEYFARAPSSRDSTAMDQHNLISEQASQI
jgi:hypothetical protein